jgi:Flp pilus assembly protein TadD
LEINPNCVVAENDLGVALSEKGQPARAIEHFQRAIKIDPNFAPARNNLGIVLLQKGQLGEAVNSPQ